MLGHARHGVARWPRLLLNSAMIVVLGAVGMTQAPGGPDISYPSPLPAAPGFQHLNLPEAATTVGLQGSVRIAKGGTVSRGVQVRVESMRGEVLAEQPVTTAGQFAFTNIPKLTCQVVVSGEGFETFSQTMDLGRGGNIFFLNVTLTPLSSKQALPSPPVSRTDLSAPKEARKEFDAGSKALEARKLRQASNHLEKAVSLYPCYARAQADLGLVHIAERKSAPAEAALRKAIECDPDYIESYIALAELLNANQRYQESSAVLEEGIRRSPSSWPFFYQLGVCYYGMGKTEDAEQAYLKAQTLGSNLPPEIHIKLADVYVKEKAFDKAYTQMQAYLDADPKGPLAARTRSVMGQMAAAGVVSPSALKTAPPDSAARQNH